MSGYQRNQITRHYSSIRHPGELGQVIARGRDDHQLRSDLQLTRAASGWRRARHAPAWFTGVTTP